MILISNMTYVMYTFRLHHKESELGCAHTSISFFLNMDLLQLLPFAPGDGGKHGSVDLREARG